MASSLHAQPQTQVKEEVLDVKKGETTGQSPSISHSACKTQRIGHCTIMMEGSPCGVQCGLQHMGRFQQLWCGGGGSAPFQRQGLIVPLSNRRTESFTIFFSYFCLKPFFEPAQTKPNNLTVQSNLQLVLNSNKDSRPWASWWGPPYPLTGSSVRKVWRFLSSCITGPSYPPCSAGIELTQGNASEPQPIISHFIYCPKLGLERQDPEGTVLWHCCSSKQQPYVCMDFGSSGIWQVMEMWCFLQC